MILRNLLNTDRQESTLTNPSDWLKGLLNPTEITTQGAYSNSNVFTCVSILADDIAKLPIHTFYDDGGKIRSASHPVAKLLYERPNPLMTAYTFKQLMQTNIGLFGNAYALIKFDYKGQPIELWPIEPSKVTVKYDETLTYEVSVNGKKKVYQTSDVLHLKGASRDGIVGIPPWKTLIDELSSQESSKRFVKNFYKKGTMASGILKTGSKLDKDAKQKMREMWESANGGSNNGGSVAILDVGLDYKQIGMNLDQAQFIETQKFGINEVAKVYKIPPHKLAQLDRATYANAEAMGLEYIKTTLLPIFTQWEQEINYKLFSEKEREFYYVKFNANAELRGDGQARASFYKEMLAWGIMTINEVRALEELNSVVGEMGDKHFVSLNYTTLDNLEQLQLVKKGGEGNGKKDNNNGV